MEKLFETIFKTDALGQMLIKPSQFALCLLVSLALGIAIAFTHLYRTNSSKSFLFSLAV